MLTLTLQYLLEVHLPIFAGFLDLGALFATLHLNRSTYSLRLLNPLKWNCRFRRVFVAPGRRPASDGAWVETQLRWYLQIERLLEQASFTGSQDFVYEFVHNWRMRLSEPGKPNQCTSLPQTQQEYSSWIRQLNSSEKELLYLGSGVGPLSVTVRKKLHHRLHKIVNVKFFHGVCAAAHLLHMDCVAQAQLWKIVVLRRSHDHNRCLCQHCFAQTILKTVKTYGLLRRGVIP